MARIVLIDGDGNQVERVVTPGSQSAMKAKRNPRHLREIRVKAWPDHWARYDAGKWVADPSLLEQFIDPAHLADNGEHSIRFAHLQKSIEAQLIVAGVDLPHSLLAAEAKATDQPLAELAAAAVAKGFEIYYAAEIARREAKIAARGAPVA